MLLALKADTGGKMREGGRGRDGKVLNADGWR